MAKIKKGSAAAKAWGRKMKRLRSGTASPKPKSSTTKYKPKRTMAKRRYTKSKRRAAKKSASFFGISLGKATAAMLYGAMRAKTSNLLAPYTSKLPLGNIGDEVGMIAASVAAKKYVFKKAGVLRDALNAGQTIELARIGDAAASGDLNLPFLTGGAAAPSTNGNIF